MSLEKQRDETPILQRPPDTIGSGTVTIALAGTAQQITATSTPTKKVYVAADLGNTNPVVVGDINVVAASGSMRGIVLIPGNPSIPIEIDNLSKLYVDSQTNNDELVYCYVC